MNRTTPPPGRLKAFDPASDAEAVIRLIEDSFNLKGDPESMSIIEQMRQATQNQSAWNALPGTEYRQPGYVWVVDGRIVGNINIISFMERLRHIALIANVAVKPEFQHLGIATAMTKHALRYARQKRAAEVWLQVSADNVAARNLYAGLGFDSIRRLNNWVLEQGEPKLRSFGNCDPTVFKLTRRRLGDWGAQRGWLECAYPPDTRWYAPVNFNQFPPFSWLNPLSWDPSGSLTHFALRRAGQLAGALTWQRGMMKSDHLWLALPETEAEDTNTLCLLGDFLNNHWQGRVTRLEYPVDRAEAVLEKLGFRLNRTLEWMKLRK